MIRDTRLVFGYELRRTLRSPTWVLFGVFQPLLWLLLFSPLLEPMSLPLDRFVPGVLVIIVIFGAFSSGFELVAGGRSGVVERLAATPANRTALILGRVLRDGLVTGVQVMILLGTALAMGLRVPAAGLLVTIALVVLAGAGAVAVSYALALRTRDENALAAIVNFFALPLMLLAGALIPLGAGPGWLETIGRANPLFYVVEAGRDLFAGRYGEPSVPVAFGVTLAIAVLTITWATRSIPRAIA